ncbi:MAG: carbohydrate ABC transporter permease [Thermomicrobiales bacterium]
MNQSAGRRLLRLRTLVIYLPVALYLLFTLFPIYWLLNSSFKPFDELFSFPPKYWPEAPSFENYANAVTETRLGALYLNSIFVAALTCATLLVVIVFAGYAMARFRFRGKHLIILLFLLAQTLPPVVLIIPLFTMLNRVGLVDSRAGLVLVYAFTWLPFSVLMMRGFFASIPEEIDEAAMIDGCGRTAALLRVVLPSALPGLVATSIFGFINAWNELIYAVVLISSPDLQTLPVGLSSMMDENRTEYGMMMAIAALALIPTLLFFAWIQRYLTGGLSAGAVKG